MCATCISPRSSPQPGTRRSSTRPEATTTTPGTVTPHQNMPFSPALKRCEGTSWSPNMPPAFDSQTKSARLAMLSRTKTRITTSSDTANSGPAKLWTFFSTKVSAPKTVCPTSGSRKNLPKAITMPDSASATKAAALTQCAARSSGVKRSIMRPVSGWWPPSAPLRQ